MAAPRAGADRPAELQAAHLDCPLGRALLWMHRNLVMDVDDGCPSASQRAGRPAGDGAGEAECLEREHLGCDPRTATYGPLLARTARSRPAGLDGEEGCPEPVVELIRSMRGLSLEGPDGTDATAGTEASPQAAEPGGAGVAGAPPLFDLLVGRDVPPPDVVGSGRRWRTDARILDRARALLERWAAAQDDRRLTWVHPDAPMANMTAVAAVLARTCAVSFASGGGPRRGDLSENDLLGLWARWLTAFVGTGRGDGWLERAGLTADDVRERLDPDFRGLATALCWLAVRPGNDLRPRLVAWQALFTQAMERGLLHASPLACGLVSHIAGRPTTRGEIEAQLQASVKFVSDDLWCERTAERFELRSLELETVSTHQAVQVRLVVRGMRDPLTDPRIPQLVAATRRYRRCDGVAVHAGDLGWRLAFISGAEVAYRPGAGPRAGALLLSEPVNPGTVEQLAATGGVVADLFTAAQIA